MVDAEMTDFASSQLCALLRLPDELKLNIISSIELKRDIYNLSLTCRALEDVVTHRLYAKMDVGFPLESGRRSPTAGYQMLRPHVIRSLKELTLRTGQPNIGNSAYTSKANAEDGSTDDYVREMVMQVPPEQLTSFGYLHGTPTSLSTLGSLAMRQSTTLKQLRVFELGQTGQGPGAVPSNLTHFECRSILEGGEVGKIIQANQDKLQTLRLGQEKDIVERYRNTRGGGFLQDIPQSVDTFISLIKPHNLPNLRRLDLCALDVSALGPADFQQALPFCNLTRLSLESCTGSEILLSSLADTFDFVQNSADAPKPRLAPQLTEFLFRSEAPTNALKESLISFLASFRGLKTLSILFDNAPLLERASTIISEHGTTLETLVLESRVQPRMNLGLDTSRPFGVGGYSSDLWAESISDICNLCSNLVELGTGFPWNDELVRVRKTPLPTLRKLRTIHIRNFPESQVLSQLGDYTIKEYATKFIEWVFPGLVGAERPNLENVAIGPTIYESRWKHSATRRQPLEFARTHYFCLDWAQTRFRRWSVMVTPVSEKCVEEMREEKPLGGVFEQVWLR